MWGRLATCGGLRIRPRGQVRSCEVNLAPVATYTGAINQFRFDPIAAGRPGRAMDLYCISPTSSNRPCGTCNFPRFGVYLAEAKGVHI